MENSKKIHVEQEPAERVNVTAVIIIVGIMILMMAAIGWALIG